MSTLVWLHGEATIQSQICLAPWRSNYTEPDYLQNELFITAIYLRLETLQGQ